MSGLEIFKTVLFLYLLYGFGLAMFSLQAILLAADYLHKHDGIPRPSIADAIFIFFYAMFFWGWGLIRPHWERVWRTY